MKPLTKSVVVALIQVLIVCSLGAKLLYDRRTRPQAWFLTQRYDPNLPIRGRYLSLQVEVKDPRSPEEVQRKFASEIQMYQNQRYATFYGFGQECGSIALRDGSPVAEFDDSRSYGCENLGFQRWNSSNGPTVLRVMEPVLFFISDKAKAKDPSWLARGDELWVLATIPRKGPPRPIALGLKKAGENDIRRLGLD
jgi:hypothetical protein